MFTFRLTNVYQPHNVCRPCCCAPGPTVTGAQGTYNHLIDAVLDVPRTRQMYMRRLRTLMDTFMATNRLQVGGWVGWGAARRAAASSAMISNPCACRTL